MTDAATLTKSSLLIYYQNCRGLNTKLAGFYENLSDLSYDVVCVTESWLSDSVNSSECFPPNYNVIRCDRRFEAIGRSRGGGAILGLSNAILYTVIDTTFLTNNIPLVDIILCKCVSPIKLIICLVYIPPDISAGDLELLTSSLDMYLMDEQILLLGDFNLPNFILEVPSCAKTSTFLHFCSLLELQQRNNVFNVNNRLLDLVLTPEHSVVSVCRADVPIVQEDIYHPALDIIIELTLHQKQHNFPSASNHYLNFRKANCTTLCEALDNIDWSPLSSYDNINLALNYFYFHLNKVFESNIPRKKTSTDKFPSWFTFEIKRNIKTKDYYRRKWLNTKNRHCLYEFKRLRSLIKQEIATAYSAYLARVQSSIKSDVGMLWRFVDEKHGRTRIPGVLYYNDIELDNPQTIVNCFAKLFSESYITDDMLYPADDTYLPSFSLGPVAEDRLVALMSRLPDKMTAGDDCVPSFIIKSCRYSLAQPLTTLINLSVKLGVFPARWKISRVIPVFKKGETKQVANYRPISILCNFGKLYEQVLYDSIYASVHPYLSPLQHGFMSGRSTITNLASVTQYISESLDNRGQVDVVYTDISRAFDTISHPILLKKLSAFGFSPAFTNLMRTYLQERVAYVCYNGFHSYTYEITSGVPQGSNLGPLLYLLYMDDLLKSLTCPALAYADDLKIYSVILTPADADLIQANVDMIFKWCNDNKLKLNIGKCSKVTYTRRTLYYVHTYQVDNIPLVANNTIRDLGVTFDSSLNFISHINELCRSASKALGFIIRNTREFSDTSLIRVLYFALVMSKLEYASIVWYPIYNVHCQNLERIHRRFLRLIAYKTTGSYPPRGANLDDIMTEVRVGSLASRREYQSATFLKNLSTIKLTARIYWKRYK